MVYTCQVLNTRGKKKSLLSRIHILVEETQADMTGGALIRTSEENKAE